MPEELIGPINQVHFHGSTLSGAAKRGSSEQHDQYSTHHMRVHY